MELASEIGVHRSLVGRLRRVLRIPKYDRVAKVVHLLGRVSDRELSRRCGITAKTIARRRHRMGIPPHKQSKSRAHAAIETYVKQLREELES